MKSVTADPFDPEGPVIKCMGRGGYFASPKPMRINESFDEIRVYAGFAERTGEHFDRSAVRRSSGYCRSLTELLRKARASGDGCYYLPISQWPPDAEKIEIQKPWVVVSTLPE